MSPVDTTTINEKLLRLREITKTLEEFSSLPREKFLNDAVTNAAVMYNLIIGIEIIVDIGNHLLAEVFQRSEKTYRDVIRALGETGVVPSEFAREEEFMADFRNKIIHDYDRVDAGRVFDALQKAPTVFREFAQRFTKFIENK